MYVIQQGFHSSYAQKKNSKTGKLMKMMREMKLVSDKGRVSDEE